MAWGTRFEVICLKFGGHISEIVYKAITVYKANRLIDLVRCTNITCLVCWFAVLPLAQCNSITTHVACNSYIH